MQYPASCFSGHAGFSDLEPPDGGWSQNPAGTDSVHVNLYNKTRFGYRYVLSALNPGTIVLLTRQTLELAVRQGDRRVTRSSSWGRYQAVKSI